MFKPQHSEPSGEKVLIELHGGVSAGGRFIALKWASAAKPDIRWTERIEFAEDQASLAAYDAKYRRYGEILMCGAPTLFDA